MARVFQETPTVRTLRLVDPAGGPLPFTYRPGQFLTLTLPAAGQALRRTYTMASAPTQTAHCEVTVKREPSGAGSAYLHDTVCEDDEIAVSGPTGSFTFTGEEADSLVLIGGGVGITPMMSVVRALMDRGWDGEVFLLYAVRSSEEVIFGRELALLAERNPNLHLLLVAEEAGPTWQGAIGQITADMLAGFVPDLARRRVHLCGPAPMMAAMQEALASLGVPEAQVLIESFGVPVEEIEAALAAGPQLMEARVTFQRSGRTVSLAPPQTLVDAAEAGGVKLDYSCRSGTCGTCRVRVVKGTVSMARRDALLAADEAEGTVLACQARPTSPEVMIDAQFPAPFRRVCRSRLPDRWRQHVACLGPECARGPEHLAGRPGSPTSVYHTAISTSPANHAGGFQPQRQWRQLPRWRLHLDVLGVWRAHLQPRKRNG